MVRWKKLWRNLGGHRHRCLLLLLRNMTSDRLRLSEMVDATIPSPEMNWPRLLRLALRLNDSMLLNLELGWVSRSVVILRRRRDLRLGHVMKCIILSDLRRPVTVKVEVPRRWTCSGSAIEL